MKPLLIEYKLDLSQNKQARIVQNNSIVCKPYIYIYIYMHYSQFITVFLDCLHTKIKSSTLLAKPYTQEAKHQPIFAQL